MRRRSFSDSPGQRILYRIANFQLLPFISYPLLPPLSMAQNFHHSAIFDGDTNRRGIQSYQESLLQWKITQLQVWALHSVVSLWHHKGPSWPVNRWNLVHNFI